MKRKALGKGLDALIPQPSSGPRLHQVDTSRIRPNSFQPRVRFEPQRLQELADSILENGVLQPVIVRRVPDGFELVAGERRWRAAQKAGLAQIPAIIQDLSDQKILELALVENIQRDELNAIEEAHAYQLLIEHFNLSQEEVARKVGRNRTTVTNTLRLLRLPKRIQALVLQNALSMGHARALLPLPEKAQRALVQQIMDRDLSVREVERRVKQLLSPPRQPAAKDPNLRAAEVRLEEQWMTRVEIRQKGQKGQILFHYHSAEELQRLYEGLVQKRSSSLSDTKS